MRIDQPVFDAYSFAKSRERLLEHEVADQFFAAVVRQAKLRRYMSSDHFSVDGTLLNAWASHKSFKPKDGPPTDPPAGRNVEVQWHGRETLQRHPCLHDRSGSTVVSQEPQHRRHALLLVPSADGAPLTHSSSTPS